MFDGTSNAKGHVYYYNLTLWMLAGNCINFPIAASLIGLHMPGVKLSVYNESERVSPDTPCKSPIPFIGNSSNHKCQNNITTFNHVCRSIVNMFYCERRSVLHAPSCIVTENLSRNPLSTD